MQVTSDRIVWDRDDFLAGFVPAQASSAVRFFGTRGSAFHKNIFSPFATVPGSLVPGPQPTSLTNVSTEPDALLTSHASNPASVYVYAIGGTKFHQIDISSDTLTASGGTFPSTRSPHGGHSSLSFAVGDMAYYNRSGTAKIFYSWNDNTDWDVGIFDLTSTFDDDFMSTVPTTPLASPNLAGGVGVPHPLYVATDEIMYIGSKGYVHSYDGRTDTFVAQDLNIGAQNTVVTFTETDTDLVIFATNAWNTGRRGRARAFFWDASRPESFYRAIDLDDDEVGAAFKFRGTIGCFTAAKSFGGFTTLRLLQGNRFVPVFSFSGGIPGNRGVFVMNDMIFWVSGGGVYAWGGRDSKFPNGAFWLCSGSGTTNGGFLNTFVSSVLYASTGTGSSGGLQNFPIATFSGGATSFWQSIHAAPNFPRGFKARVVEVKVTFAGTCSGGRSMDLQIRASSNAASITTVATITTVTSSTMVQRFTADSTGADLPEFENLQARVVYNDGSSSSAAPAIEKIEVFYKLVKIK